MIMRFTSKKTSARLASAVLALAGLGWMGVPATRLQAATPEDNVYMAAWYNNKHWWKKHAPIIGGAAGGGLIGGLAGGGKGALIGGAAGAGGGYLYKHLKDKHHHGEAYRSTDQPVPQHPEHGR